MREDSLVPMIHEDAGDLLNVTSSLKTVCHDLRDRNKRSPRKVHPGSPASSFGSPDMLTKWQTDDGEQWLTWSRVVQDVEPLSSVRPQLARSGVTSVEQAFQLMKGKPFLVETKFDGNQKCLQMLA